MPELDENESCKRAVCLEQHAYPFFVAPFAAQQGFGGAERSAHGEKRRHTSHSPREAL